MVDNWHHTNERIDYIIRDVADLRKRIADLELQRPGDDSWKGLQTQDTKFCDALNGLMLRVRDLEQHNGWNGESAAKRFERIKAGQPMQQQMQHHAGMGKIVDEF